MISSQILDSSKNSLFRICHFTGLLVRAYFSDSVRRPPRKLPRLTPSAIHVFTAEKDYDELHVFIELQRCGETGPRTICDSCLDRQHTLLSYHAMCILPAVGFTIFVVFVLGNDVAVS